MFNHIITELKTYKPLDWVKLLLIIGMVVAIGLFCVNQFLDFRYKAEFLTTPCQLCLEINKNVDLCPKVEAIDLETIPFDFLELPE